MAYNSTCLGHNTLLSKVSRTVLAVLALAYALGFYGVLMKWLLKSSRTADCRV